MLLFSKYKLICKYSNIGLYSCVCSWEDLCAMKQRIITRLYNVRDQSCKRNSGSRYRWRRESTEIEKWSRRTGFVTALMPPHTDHRQEGTLTHWQVMPLNVPPCSQKRSRKEEEEEEWRHNQYCRLTRIKSRTFQLNSREGNWTATPLN